MVTAIILAAGRGRRMESEIPKQFLPLGSEPLIVRTIRVFEDCPDVDRIFLVTGDEYLAYCRDEIVKAYGFTKVADVIEGGGERWESVQKALAVCRNSENPGGQDDIVMIHDGARPFVRQESLLRVLEAARECGAAALAVPSRDTIKIADEEGYVIETPRRSQVWAMQTPQVFRLGLIFEANEKLLAEGGMQDITDDAMIVERSGLARVRLIEGTYDNIKITTPEDMLLAEAIAVERDGAKRQGR